MIDLEFTDDSTFALITVHQNLDSIGINDMRSLMAGILRRQAPLIIIDMSRVTKLSVAGTGLIFTLNNRAREAGRHIAYLLSPEVRKSLAGSTDQQSLLVAETINKAKILLRKKGFKEKKQPQ